MGLDYLDKGVRVKILTDIKSEENRARKRKSLKEFDCFTDNLKKYVDQEITSQFSAKTKSMMPVVSSINLVKRIVDQQSTIYSGNPERTFTGLSDESLASVLSIYNDSAIDSKNLKAEKLFNLQKQTHVYFRLIDGKIVVQPLYLHNMDAVESENNPEVAEAYIISNFDKLEDVDSDQVNQLIADKDDFKKSLERYTLWTNDLNFVFDGNGNIVGDPENTANEIGIIPIVDLSLTKDFTYFVQDGGSLVNFAIDYNVALSDLMFISRLQGFAQGAVSGDKEALDKMTTVEMGPAHIIKLANSSDGNPTKLEFIQRGSDINGSISAIEILLSNFLTSSGIDPKIISGKGEGIKYSSGVERLLAMVERFEASRSNFDLFSWYESMSYEIIKAYIRTYGGNQQLLNPKYFAQIPEDSEVTVKWSRPELVQGEADRISIIKAKIDAGLMSKIEAIMMDREISRDEAEKVFMQIGMDTISNFSIDDDQEDDQEEVNG